MEHNEIPQEPIKNQQEATLKIKEGKSNSDEMIISFNVKQLFTFSIFFITFGASLYTFFRALPKLDGLEEKYDQLTLTAKGMKDDIEAIKGNMVDIKNDVRDYIKPKPPVNNSK